MRNLDNIKRIIVKVGSSSLCDNNGKIEKEKILQLVLQISQLKSRVILLFLSLLGLLLLEWEN